MAKRILLSGLFLIAVTILATRMTYAVPSNFQNEIVIGSGLTFPTALEFLPDGRMLIAEFRGKVWVAQPGATQVDSAPALQLINIINEDVVAGGERGLVNIMADPNFSSNGYIYLFYTANSPQRDRVSRFTMVGNTANLSTELVLWQGVADSTSTDHHGGGIAVGADGKLYIATGDNGDPPSSQPLNTDHGKMLRINLDGTVPTDNPFFDGAGPNIDAIWARGLRNPYRISFDAPSGKIYISDVGQFLFEEVNVGARGANYGWPTCEGNCSTSGMTNPIFNYSHNGRDSAITGGFIYRGSQFPVSYQGVFFYGDYAQNWIRYLTFDGSGNVMGSQNFEPTDATLDGPYGDPVMFKQGPEGSLYYVDFGWPGPDNPAAIRRIRYTAANQPPTAIIAASPVSGPTPLSVNFSSAGSFDPEGQPLTYNWAFGDGTNSTQANPNHVYQQAGLYSARLTLSDGVNITQSNVITISAGNAPTGTITSPANGLTFRAGDIINFSGTATDPDEGNLPASAFSWTILFHHDSHVHPALGPLNGTKAGTFTIASSGHDFTGNTNYEIILTVTDSTGLQHRSSVFIFPQKVNLNFSSSPSGLTLTIDGIGQTTPFTKDDLIGFQHTIAAPNQSLGGTAYAFGSWSDAGAQSHTITVPATAQSYSATYQVSGPSLPPGQVAAYSFDEGMGTTAADVTGNNHTGTLTNGPTWTTGKFGGGLSLDGANDFVAIASADTLNFGTSDFTIALWVKRGSSNTEDTILSKTASSGWVSGGKELFLNSGNDRISLGSFGVGETVSTGTPPTSDGNWHYIAITFADSTNSVNFYTDGQPSGGGTLNLGPDIAGHVLRIGTNPPQYFHGLIDELRIYNRALSQTEIQTIMIASVGAPPQDTTPPVRSNGQPSGVLPAGTSQVIISLNTDETAICRYSTVAGTAFDSMTGIFSNTNSTTHSTTITGLSDGASYTFYARARDAAGNTNNNDFAISFSIASPPPPDTTPPVVNITSPANGATVSGTITVSATASDNVGVVGVQFVLDNNNLGAEDTSSPYSVSWNTATASPGQHTLQARARDAASNKTTASVTVNVIIIVPGLVAAYSFNEGSGFTAADASGNQNTGMITNATWITQGKYGKALQFNGLTDWVMVADADSLDLANGMTIEAWVFPIITPTGWRTIIAKEQTDGLAYYLYASSKGSNIPTTGVFISPSERNLSGGTRLAANAWTHIAATYNGSIQRLYINGVQVSSRTQSGSISVGTGVLRIGGNDPFGEFFKGIIDEVRVYNLALTQSQIQSDMNTPIAP